MKRKLLLILSLLLMLTVLFTACDCKGNKDPEDPTESSIYFNEEVYAVDRYSMITLNINYKGEEAIEWSTSDGNIALVHKGTILGVNAGTAKITAKVGEETAECSVMVKATDAYMTLNLTQTQVELALENKKTLGATLTDINGTKYPSVFVSYEFSPIDDKVSVDGNVVTAKKIGESGVLVKAHCAGRTVEEIIKVIAKEDVNVAFDKTTVSLFSNSLGGIKVTEEQLNLFVYENGAKKENATVSYSVENPLIASVTANGVVKGLTKGETKVIATYVSEAGTSVDATINVNIEYPEVLLDDTLELEVFAKKDSKFDLSEYSSYFDGEMNSVTIQDDYGNFSSGTMSNGVATIDNSALSYGFRRLSFIVNKQVKFTAKAEVVTKFIKTANELSNFAVEYGGRGDTGSYEGYFKLANDIDMTGVKINYHVGNDGALYAVTRDDIGFKGIFDGQGYTIYNAKNNVFGRVSKDGIIKNVGFYSDNEIDYGQVAVLFAGTLENVFVHADLSFAKKYENVTEPPESKLHYASIAYRTLGEAVFKNVVVEVANIHEWVECTFVYDTDKFPPTAENVYVISPSSNDLLTYHNYSYKGEIIRYSLAQTGKDFAKLDKKSGYWQDGLENYKFKTSTAFELDPVGIPDVSTFAVDGNGTLTWGAVANADGYRLLINGETFVETATNSYAGFDQGTVKILAKGNGLSYRNGLFSEEFVSLKPAKGYLADFSSIGYQGTVLALPITAGAGTCNIKEVTWLQDGFNSVTENVLKVTPTKATWYYGFKLKLPKSATSKIEIKLYVEYAGTDNLGFYFDNPDVDYAGSDATGHLSHVGNFAKNSWGTYTIDYSSVTKKDEVNIVAFDNGSAQTATFYIAYVKDVDLASTLESGYLADFSSNDYESLVGSLPITAGAGSCNITENAWLQNGFNGVTENVLKVTPTKAVWYYGFKLKLPKATTSKIEIKLYVEYAGTDTLSFYFDNPDVEYAGSDVAGHLSHVGNFVKNSWVTYTVDYTSVTAKDEVNIVAFDNGSAQTATFYVAYVKEVQ